MILPTPSFASKVTSHAGQPHLATNTAVFTRLDQSIQLSKHGWFPFNFAKHIIIDTKNRALEKVSPYCTHIASYWVTWPLKNAGT